MGLMGNTCERACVHACVHAHTRPPRGEMVRLLCACLGVSRAIQSVRRPERSNKSPLWGSGKRGDKLTALCLPDGGMQQQQQYDGSVVVLRFRRSDGCGSAPSVFKPLLA